MTLVYIPVASRHAIVDVPEEFAGTIGAFFPLAFPMNKGIANLTIGKASDGLFRVKAGEAEARPGLTTGDVIAAIRIACADIAASTGNGTVMRAGAVGWGERSVIVAARPGGGATSLVAWLVENGFSYIADDTLLIAGDGAVPGIPAPLSIAQPKAAHLSLLPAFHDAPTARAGDRLLLAPDRTWIAPSETTECGLAIFVAFERGAALSLEAVPQPTWRLLEATRDVVLPSDDGFAPVANLAGRTPAFTLRYGDYAQLQDTLDVLVKLVLESAPDPADIARFVAGLSRAPTRAAPTSLPPRFAVPERTGRKLQRRMTIGMATYDDYDGAYFTIQALRMYHPEAMDDVEIVVIDNHPDGPCAAPLKALENAAPNYRYVPAGDITGTAIRDRVFSEAAGDFVLCVDCHIFLVPGALRRLLDYFAANPGTIDLLQGPLIAENLTQLSTHFDPVWREGMYGVWAHDPRGDDPDGAPFDIPMQGLGVFACRRAAWPGFNPAFRGFGGEEGYIHEKVRQRGGRTLCLPFLRWMHRFSRPMGVPYPNRWEDRFRNYLIGLTELGLPTAELEAHMREKIGKTPASALIASVRQELTLTGDT